MSFTSPSLVRSLTAVTLLLIVLPVAQSADLTFHGPGYQPDARAIAIAPNGDIWVGSTSGIESFTPDGVFKKVERTPGFQPNSMIFDGSGNLIVGFNLLGVSFYRQDREEKIDSSQFTGYSPWEIALDGKGSLWATNTGGGNLKRFEVGGTLPVLAQTTQAPGLEHPYSIALDEQGRLYVSDQDKPGLWLFNADGTFAKQLLPDTKCWRVRRGPDGIYVVVDDGVLVLDPATGSTLRHLDTLGGYADAMGFAVDKTGGMYFGSFNTGLVRHAGPDGKVDRTMGASYSATLSVPEAWQPGQIAKLPLKLLALASKPVGTVPPKWSAELEPVTLGLGDPDLDYVNHEGSEPDPNWSVVKGVQKLVVKPEGDGLTVTLPAVAAPNFYRLKFTASTGAPPGVPGAVDEKQQIVRVISPDSGGGSLTLFSPRGRTVFQYGEKMEINAILRDRKPLAGGTLQFSLAHRPGDDIAFQHNATSWKSFPIEASSQTAATLTFRASAGAIHPGRYLLQAQYQSAGKTLRDVWPLQIVAGIEPTRFRILFPEWSAGYTDIWGPFMGKGLQKESAYLASEGIRLYDTGVSGRGQSADVVPTGEAAHLAPTLMAQAAQETSLPAPEKYLPNSGLELEMQEALRNGLTVQRDFWGTHFLNNWGMAHPRGVPRDNRIAKMWTQWQREWPSWIGHRYLTLSLDEGDNSERAALVEQSKVEGLVPPTEDELKWARNGGTWSDLRRYITDAPAPPDAALTAVGCDQRNGDVVVGSRAGVLMRYKADGTLIWKASIPHDIMDLAVAKDGTIYGAHLFRTVSVTTPDGKSTHWSSAKFDQYSPRGIAIAPDGNLLISDETQACIARYTPDGKYLGDFADKKNLAAPGGLTIMKNGDVVVADGGRAGVTFFRPDGTPYKFIPKSAIVSTGGKVDVLAAPDDTLWTTMGWGALNHYDREGKQLIGLGRPTFAPGGVSLPMSLAWTPSGHMLVADVALPYVQEIKEDTNEAVRLYGMGTFLADVRVDRKRVLWDEHVTASVWMPVRGYEGDSKSTLQAFARPSESNEDAFKSVPVKAYSGGDFAISPPHFNGQIVLRLIWAPPGAKVDEPRHTDFQVDVAERVSPEDQKRYDDILSRERKWKEKWARTRMGTLVRWTKLSDSIAVSGGHARTQNTAPTNYGTPDTLAEGVWVPYRREALVAEAENEGHDHGSFPVMGPFYVARALEGPDPKPAWSSLLQWYWEYRENHVTPSPRILRDVVTLLGTGASGMGTGTVVSRMTPPQLDVHRKMVDILHRLGDASTELDLPGTGGVAILHSFTQEAMDPYMEEQFYATHAAWYDLLRAHIPNAVTSEESIARGELKGRFKAVLLPYILHLLPEETMKGLRDFQAGGGEVWVDLGSRIKIPGAKILQTRYRPFWSQDAYYWMHTGYGVGGYDGNYEYWRMRQGSNGRMPAIKTAFEKFNTMPVTTADADVFLQQREGGQARYFFAGGDHFPDKELINTWLANDVPVPASTAFTIKVPIGGAVYDAMAMKRIEGGALTVDFTNDQPARIWAFLPRPIASVSVKASAPANPGDQLFVTAIVNDATGKLISAVIPLEVTITQPDGTVYQHLWRGTGKDGICRIKVPIGWMAKPGNWQVAVRELLGGTKAAPASATAVARPVPQLTREESPALIFDGATIAQWLSDLRGKEVWIALDKKQDALRPEAERLAAALQKTGIKPRIIDIAAMPREEVFMSYAPSKEQQAVYDRIKNGQAVGTYKPDGNAFISPGSELVVMRPLILLGDPEQNSWMQEINYWHLVRRSPSPNYPGAGRALVQYCWAPFYDGYDAVTITATDIAGVRAGIEALTNLAEPKTK